MIGTEYFQDDDSFPWETSESGRLLSIYEEKRLTLQKPFHAPGRGFHDNEELSVPPLLSVGFSGQDNERSSGTDERDPSSTKPAEYLKSQTKIDLAMKQGRSNFSKHDPRRVAVSWYSYYHLRPGSPTQWEQMEDQHTDLTGRLGMAMGIIEEEQVPLGPDNSAPLKSDIALLEKLSNMAEPGRLMDQADLEVADIYNEKHQLLRTFNTDQSPRWQDLKGETSQLLIDMRRSSPPI